MNPVFLVNGIFPAYFAGNKDFDIKNIQENFAYVLDGQGWKIYKKNGISTAIITVDDVHGLNVFNETISFTAIKLPLELIRKVTAWFKAVYHKHESEAVGYLYYHLNSGNWEFIPPTQTATGASASYESAPKKEGWQVAGTIHSHGSMSAFHSGTDDADEAFFDGVHITVGNVNTIPEYSCSIVVQGKREVMDPSVLINGMAPANEVPYEWMTAVKLSAPTGLEVSFQSKADTLYKRYYLGEITEELYQKELEKIEKASDNAKQKRLVLQKKNNYTDHTEGFSGYNKKGKKGW